MHNGQDIDLVGLDVVDDPVWAFDHLPDLLQSIFWNDSAGLGKCRDLLRSPRQAVHHVSSIFRRILRNIVIDSGQMILSRFRPVDVHFGSPYCARTSRTSIVRPALLSASP